MPLRKTGHWAPLPHAPLPLPRAPLPLPKPRVKVGAAPQARSQTCTFLNSFGPQTTFWGRPQDHPSLQTSRRRAPDCQVPA